MSTDEQDRILGKLTRERAECKRAIVAQEAEVRDLADKLIAVGSKLKGFIESGGSGDDVVISANKLPDKESMSKIITDFHNERQTLLRLEDQIRRSGD